MTSVLSSSSATGHRPKRSMAEPEETVVPDSTTTTSTEFQPGQDILLKHKDGRYYFGTVVEVDGLREQCLVKFGDNTDNWSCFKDLVKLSTPEREDLLCVLCKKSAPKNKNEITVCYKCGRGYHQKCHFPEIPAHCLKEDSNWMCKRCVETEPLKQRKSAELKQTKKDSRKTCENPSSSNKSKSLPYDPDSLSWDTYHRVNLEQTYCYCGDKGDWYTQMLQCGRCRQWFHEKCVGCLKYPLYCGDRFYVFVCSICNQGKEFVRRLEMNWVDLVHLMLFNLTAFNSKKYYDLNTVIIPYVNDNWHALQLPPKIVSVSKNERRENILSVLTNNRNRFKCGREIKKRTTIWGLRVRLPPPAPCITLSSIGVITEDELKERWQGNRRLQFLPYPDVRDPVVPVDVHMLNVMMGTAYQDHHVMSETESPCPSPELVVEEKKTYDNSNYSGAGCVKKSVPFSRMSLKHKKRLMSLNLRKRDKLFRRQKRKGSKEEVKRRTTRVSLDNNRKNAEAMPLTPPTSVSAPPTPPTSGSSNVGPELSTDYSEHSNSLVQALKKDKLAKGSVEEPHTPCDTSGDETSSKSTLDLIIPPPKDFEGKNNPFLTFLRGQDDLSKKRRSKDAITLPLPLTAVIPGRPVAKPLKRQLSEKDICIGPNGEVKRRRFRRNRSGNLANYGQTASKTAAVVPVRPDANDWGQRLRSNQTQIGNCVDYALNGRRLRQRQDKSVEKDKKQPTPKPSPVKQDPDINIDDLKSSVHSYFGAAMRILDGERFTVKAKRYGPTGKLEYLMEWEGVSNGMT